MKSNSKKQSLKLFLNKVNITKLNTGEKIKGGTGGNNGGGNTFRTVITIE